MHFSTVRTADLKACMHRSALKFILGTQTIAVLILILTRGLTVQKYLLEWTWYSGQHAWVAGSIPALPSLLDETLN